MYPIYEVNGSSEILDRPTSADRHPWNQQPQLNVYWPESRFPTTSRNRMPARHQRSGSVTISSISRSPSTPSFQALVQSENQLNSTFTRDVILGDDGFFAASEYDAATEGGEGGGGGGAGVKKASSPLSNIYDYDSSAPGTATQPDNYYFRKHDTPPLTSYYQQRHHPHANAGSTELRNSQTTHSSNTLQQLYSSSDSHEVLAFGHQNPRTWSVDQVCVWLCTMGLDSIVENFKYHEITGAVLMDLDIQTIKELDILPFGKRYVIMQAINALKNASQSAMTIAAEPMDAELVSRNSAALVERNGEVIKAVDDYREEALSNQGALTIRSEHPVAAATSTSTSSAAVAERDGGGKRRPPLNKRTSETRFTLARIFGSVAAKEVAVQEEQETGNTRYVIKGSSELQVVAPDLQGWVNFSTRSALSIWKKRWFVLKGDHLYYAKEPRAAEVKSFCSLYGFRLTTDAEIHRGNYGFVLNRSDSSAQHRFSCLDPEDARQWIRALLKATIDRDPFASATVSSAIPTIPLHVARAKHNRRFSISPPPPPPRPLFAPAPTARTSTDAGKPKGIQYASLPAPPPPPPAPLSRHHAAPVRMMDEERQEGAPEGKRVSGFFRNGVSRTPTSEEVNRVSGGSETFHPLKERQRSGARWSSASRRSRNNDSISIKS